MNKRLPLPILLTAFFLLTISPVQHLSASAKDSGTFACSTAETTGRMGGSNAVPMVIPTLHTWIGGAGAMHLSSRIVLEPRHAKELQPLAKLLASELNAITRLSFTVAIGSNIRSGDIALGLSPCTAKAKAEIGDEGNTLLLQNAVVIRANTSRGLFYGTRTLLQMLTLHPDSTETLTTISSPLDPSPNPRHLNRSSARFHRTLRSGETPVFRSSPLSHPSLPRGFAIDYPRYATRSLLLDVGRKFLSKQFLEDTMRSMSWYKLNTLHLHLNDQADAIDSSGNLNYPFVVKAFRLKSDKPEFAGLIPADGKVYTRRDWNDLEDLAATYGIDILPEIDTPGHAAAFTRARPDLQFISSNPQDTSILDIRKPETLSYIESVFAEFLPWFRGKQIHIGGDEVSGIPAADQVRYLNALGRYLESKGKSVSIWGAEPTPEFAGPLDKNITVEWWAGKKNDWGPAGFRNINSPSSMYIIPKPGDRSAPHVLSGSAVYTNWEAVINKESPPSGGQICLWNDWAVMNYSEDYVHDMLKGVIPAAAQMFWTGHAKDGAGAVIPYATLQKSVNVFQQAGSLYVGKHVSVSVIDSRTLKNFTKDTGQRKK
jgi:hexosaminidase